MSPKWIGFVVAPAVAVAFGIASGLSLGQDQEKHKDKEHETPLGKIMEKVQKHNIALTKATRNAAAFKKSQKDVEKLAKEMAKLAKDAKPLSGLSQERQGRAESQEEVGRDHGRVCQDLRGACRYGGEEGRRPGSRENALYETRQGNLHRLPQGVPGGRQQLLTPAEQ